MKPTFDVLGIGAGAQPVPPTCAGLDAVPAECPREQDRA